MLGRRGTRQRIIVLYKCEQYFAMYSDIWNARLREKTKGHGGNIYSKTTKLLGSYTKEDSFEKQQFPESHLQINHWVKYDSYSVPIGFGDWKECEHLMQIHVGLYYLAGKGTIAWNYLSTEGTHVPSYVPTIKLKGIQMK